MISTTRTQPSFAKEETAEPAAGRLRVVIEGVQPEIDCGRYPAKGSIGEPIIVEADVFADGHDLIACRLLHRHSDDSTWAETVMTPLVNDRWRASFNANEQGQYLFTIIAWIDRFATWRRDIQKKVAAHQDIDSDLIVGSQLIEQRARQAHSADAARLRSVAAMLRADDRMPQQRVAGALEDEIAELMSRYDDRLWAAQYKELVVTVDRPKARFSTWYELFPRSCSLRNGRHGTLHDVIARLSYIANMGFDVLYLPPIHPIGRTHRKGKNNRRVAEPGDVGSPWAIGGKEGGHKAIHPELGSMDDFHTLVSEASRHGIEIALDLAYQCSPDHPYVREHPEWFRHRPDGSIQYAENPPKKYEDIYPFDFECDAWESLWEELASIVEFWVQQGVRIFRVDNPHTKAFAFWEWLINRIKRSHPDVLFLSEAFTRPKVMYRLAKLGFTQSYTYFTWRNTKSELESYFKELLQTPVCEFFRPNLWPNTPDILHEYLQTGGRPAFMCRVTLAATLAGNYGIYGPAFELCEDRPREIGSEEYLNSEKYQTRQWNLEDPRSLAPFIARLNRIRREHPALQSDRSLRFHDTDHDDVICYSKQTSDWSDTIVCVVNLNPHHARASHVTLKLDELGLDAHQTFQVHDLLGGGRYLWNGPRNYVELNPHIAPAHVFKVRHRVRSEQDFDYFL